MYHQAVLMADIPGIIKDLPLDKRRQILIIAGNRAEQDLIFKDLMGSLFLVVSTSRIYPGTYQFVSKWGAIRIMTSDDLNERVKTRGLHSQKVLVTVYGMMNLTIDGYGMMQICQI